jgi:hypothetical protein
MKWKRCGSCLAVLGMVLAMNARAQSSDETPVPTIKEDDRPAPVDWGFGPGVRPKDTAVRAVQEMMAAPAAAPGGGPDAQIKGVFAAPVTWPLIPLHTVLLPDGRVMSYGTGQNGGQGASGVYDVWNPALGTDTTAHTVLPNTTSTDIFCGGQSVMAASGEVLIVGGDQTINGQRNYSNDRATIFHPQTNAITTDAPMTYPRWYPTIVALPTGEMLVVGGREDKLPDVPVTTPEVFTQNVGWRTLWGATSDTAFGSAKAAWYYTRASPRPTARSSCWATTARCTISTRPEPARSPSCRSKRWGRPTPCRRSCSVPARFCRCATTGRL